MHIEKMLCAFILYFFCCTFATVTVEYLIPEMNSLVAPPGQQGRSAAELRVRRPCVYISISTVALAYTALK